MICPSCGVNLRDNAVFCSSCGTRITQQTMQVRVPPREERSGWDGDPQTGGSAIDEGLSRMQEPAAREPAGPPPPSGQQFGTPPPPPQGQFQQPGRGPAAGAGAGGQFGGQPRGGLGGPGMAGAAGTRGSSAGPDFNRVFSRIVPLLKLDTTVFRELRGDQSALIPSIIVAAVSILIMSLGAFLYLWIRSEDIELSFGVSVDTFNEGRFLVRSVLLGTVFGTAMWAAWVFIAGFILSQFFKRNVDPVSLLPALGLATLPFVFGLLMIIEPLVFTAGVVAMGGTAVLMQIGLQETTDASPGEVLAANLIGFLVFALVLELLGGEARDFAPGLWMLR
jgi:hypothetical protein